MTRLILFFDELVNVQLCKLHKFVCEVGFLSAHHLNFLLQDLNPVDSSFFLLVDEIWPFLVFLRALEEVSSNTMNQILSVYLGAVKFLDFNHVVAHPHGQRL